MTHSLSNFLASLPESLVERVRLLNDTDDIRDGEFVLYWMRSAVRADENPALDTALQLGNALRLPVFVYHALSDRYPYASDRHHTFILEGARDAEAAMCDRGIAYAFHLVRPDNHGPHLRTLSDQSALVITEEMPVAPIRNWTASLASQVNVPVLAIDTACVVPMQLVGKSYERAFAFRKATKKLYAERLTRAAVSGTPEVSRDVDDFTLPFVPVDLQTADIAELVSQCEIDHSIGPVPHTVGGFAAGYKRWETFKDDGLMSYARRRNHALVDGVSRMSPYLHYGMVSPMRIAREAAELDADGSEKYLDELLIWRELAYAFCYYRPDHAETSALPDWAYQTLAEHANDERSELFSWESLARGQTGDTLWDAAQRSLLIHGELHNNVRMTWGKALLNWTDGPKQALATIIDLNHRYALDGRDPASYGGILWCLGQFDRPFHPARPIFGTVRNRSTREHAKRLDPQAYMQKTTRRPSATMPSVAVIGAGISGLFCARTLSDHGFDVTVFEKSRGVGGRMATRRTDDGQRFDHGAQYFTVRDERFQRYVDSWEDDGIVQRWDGHIVVLEAGRVTEEKAGTDRYVGTPGMNSICKHLAADLKIEFETHVAPLDRQVDRWQLTNDQRASLGEFEVVVVTAPPQQTGTLLEMVPDLARRALDTPMHGCWAVMLSFLEPLSLGFDAAFVHQSPLAWVARNSSKPRRDAKLETWVLHATPEWSAENLEESPETVQSLLEEEFSKATGLGSVTPEFARAHKWRYALPPDPLADRCLFDPNLQVAVCGDWCGGPRVEGAFLSGMAAAGRILGLLKREASTRVS